MTVLLATACGGGGGQATRQPPPRPEFTTVFGQVSQDVESRFGTAAAGPDAAKACADLAGEPRRGWAKALNVAPDAVTGPVNAYLVRVQLTLYKCQDGAYAAADLARIGTLAQAVRTAVTKASPTPKPSPSTSATRTALGAPVPRGPASLPGVAALLRQAPVSLAGALCSLAVGPVAAAAPPRAARSAAGNPGFDLYRQVSGIVRGGGDVDAYRRADATLRALQPCNAAQAAYIQGNIEFNGWLAADAACKEAFYYDARTLSDVFGLWLSCIGPVNAAIVASSKKTGNHEILSAECVPGYQPPPLTASQGLLVAQATTMAAEIKAAFEEIADAREAATLFGKGVDLLLEREITPGALEEFLTSVKVMIGEAALDATVTRLRDELSTLTLLPVTQPLPAPPVKVSIAVRQEVAGLDPATGTNALTIKK